MIATIALAVVALAVLGLVTYLVKELLAATRDQLAARDLYEKQRETTDSVIEDRNALTVQLATERDKSKTLLDRLSVAESERNDATRALASKVADGIRNAPDAAGALDAINALLSVHLPGADSAAPGSDGGKAAAVQPAAAADAGKAGGHA